MSSDTNKQPLLKLDFNERGDAQSEWVTRYGEREEAGTPLWQYPDRTLLESELAERYDLSAEQLLCTNGGDEAIYILMRMLNEGRQLILPLPAFSQYTFGLDSWQLKDTQIIAPKPDLAIDQAAILEAIDNSDNSVTIITRPNNPTAEAVPLNFIEACLYKAKNNNGWIFLDEAYAEFLEEPEACLRLLSEYDNLVILRTFSKALGLAGIRLGYLMGSEQLISEFRARCMPFNVPTPSLDIARSALKSSNEDAGKYVETIRKNRTELINTLESWGLSVCPSEGNFVMLRLPEGQATALRNFLARENILVRGFTEDYLKDCLRITIPVELERLLSAMARALKPELLCFDMDGVLIDTSGSYDAAVIATVEHYTETAISLDEVHDLRRTGGYNNDWVLSRALLKERGIERSLEEVTEVFQQYYLGENNDGLVSNENPLIDSSLVEAIIAQEIPKAIVTGRPRMEAGAGMKLVGLDSLSLISLDDVKEGKPSPEGIEKLKSEFRATNVWMTGDNPDDMQAARAAGALAIGIAHEPADVNTLYEAGADVVFKSVNQLEAWL